MKENNMRKIIDFKTGKIIIPNLLLLPKNKEATREKEMKEEQRETSTTPVATDQLQLQSPTPAAPRQRKEPTKSLPAPATPNPKALPKSSPFSNIKCYLAESGIQYVSMLSRYNFSKRGQSIRYLVIHDTGNPSPKADANAHGRYFGDGNRNASAHYFVDEKQVVQVVQDQHAAWHCGDGKGKYGITNHNSLSIEICVNQDGNYPLAFVTASQLAAYLMEKYSIPQTHLVRHFDASRKKCPSKMSADQWRDWARFKHLTALYQDLVI